MRAVAVQQAGEGVDGSGRVVATGEAVRGLSPGDTVHGQFLGAPLQRVAPPDPLSSERPGDAS
ncbi:hypothetical protein ACFU76_28415 [Streptomyces sp. NPDC057539]|uniref:hypothetical protein n=1 Tax=Streptomyces sp. NPDC057539 TaxID=3346159 RepID=UPI00368374FF